MAKSPSHPALQSAAASWSALHGHKFHKNAMAKKTSATPGGPTVGKTKPAPVAGAAPQLPPRQPKLPPVVHPTPKPAQLQGAKSVSRASRVAAD